VQQAIAGARFGNERSGPRDGSNLERARSLAPGFAAMASTEEPVQAMCDACEVEEAEQDEQAGPTGEPVQAMGDPEETEAADTAEATEAPETAEATEAPEAAEADDEPVQARCAACATEAAEPSQEDPVQEDGSGPSPRRNPALIHQEARRGLGNASQPLPHADRLQAAFGHHDISQVRAAVGGAAETANRRMGALAFASGDRVAFRQTPDLRLVAHEAAHVVQQREGLALPGNVGQRGDRWERHADDVADAVAAGRSAQDLLDQVAPPVAARGGPTTAGEVAAKEHVQGRFTASAAHLSEAAPTPAEVPAAAAFGGGDAAGGGAPPSDDAAPPDDAAMNTVAEGDEGGAPPPAGGEGGSPQETVGSTVAGPGIGGARYSPVLQGVSTKLERRLGGELGHVQPKQAPEASLAAGSDVVSRAPDGNNFSFIGPPPPGVDFAAGENRPITIEGRGQFEHKLTNVAQVTPVPQGGIQLKGVAEFFEEQAWDFVRDHFPDVEPYLRNPGKLWTSLVDGVGEFIGGLVNRVVSPLRGFHPVNRLKGLFGPLLAAAVTAFKTKDCDPFFAALNVFKAKISAFTAGPLAALKAKFASIKKTIQSALKKVTAPFAKMLKQVGGTVVSFVRGLATRIGGLIQKAREWSARAVTWVQNKLGFGGKSSEEGLWELIKRKASEVWEKAKPRLLPFVGPLKTAATVIAALSPFGPVLAAIKYGPKLATWLGEVYGLLHVPERITSARAAIARTLPTIAGKLAQGALALTGIPLAIDSLRGAATALESLSTSLTGMPVLGLAGSAAKFLATKITEGVTWVGGPVKTATHGIETGLKDAGAWLEKVGHGAGRLVGLAANPFGIVGFLAGELWLAIPACFKLPILNWILDLLIGLVRAIPANPLLGPLFPLFLHGVVGFLLRVRNGGDGDEKEKVSDRLARLATGSATFVLGLMVGVVKGVGEGLLMPFTLVYDLITAIPKIVDFVNGLPSKLASGLAGIAKSVADTADEAIAGFWPAVTQALNTPGGGILQWLNKAWGALSAGSEGIGGSVAGALIGFIMLGDFELGEKLGWVAGTVLFEVVLAFLTGGATVLLKSASVPLRMLGKVLRVLEKAHKIMNEVFGLIFKALERPLKGIKKLLQNILPSLESKVGAILEKFEALIGSAKSVGEEFAGKFAGDEALALARAAEGKGAAALASAEGAGTKAEGELTDDAASAAASKEKPAVDVDLPPEKPSAPKVEEPPPAAPREPSPAPEPPPKTAETPGQTPETAKPIEAPPPESAAVREEHVAESGAKEGVDLTEKQISEELQHIADNPHLMQGTPPKRTAKIGDHTWHENPNVSWCRHSDPLKGVCSLPSPSTQNKLADAAAPSTPTGPRKGKVTSANFRDVPGVNELLERAELAGIIKLDEDAMVRLLNRDPERGVELLGRELNQRIGLETGQIPRTQIGAEDVKVPGRSGLDGEGFDPHALSPLERPKGSPPLESRIKGDTAEVRHAEEVVNKAPRAASKQVSNATLADWREDLLSGRINLEDFARRFPDEGGAAQVFLPTATPEDVLERLGGGRYIDHMYVDGTGVVLRESKNVKNFRLIEDYRRQIAKDLNIVEKFPGARSEWRISGAVDAETLHTLELLRAENPGRFNFVLDPAPVPALVP
jgi:hypothetical protein